jgi:hypothetical protein
MKYETHIQPKQAKESTQVRIPCPDENSGRPQGHSPSQKCGQKTARGLSKSFILKKRFEFRSVDSFALIKKKGLPYASESLCLKNTATLLKEIVLSG